MDNVIKKPYEISLWEDVLTFVSDSGAEYEEYIPEDATGKIVGQYYKERKICVIGSNTMDTPIRAFSPKLNPKVNGSTELTFNLYSHYYGEDGELYNNPFIKLLSNERKIKVRYGALGAEDTKWYDLVIKNIQENSENKTFQYIAKDLFINELSKSGFSLEFDTELENNMGTISQLATSVLKGSDWKLKEGESSTLEQFKEEPLYEIILNQDITATDMKNPDNTIQIKTGKTILVFYSTFVNKERHFQFLYADNYEIDDDHVITNAPENSNWYIDDMDYQNDMPEIAALGYEISKEYRGKKLVRKVITRYDATVDKYVSVFKDKNGEEVYGFIETDYTSPAATRSYITNGDMASQEVGWKKGGANDGTFPDMSFVSVPDIRDVENYKDQEFQFCLKLDNTIADGSWNLYNSGIVDHRHYIDNFIVEEEYVFRIKCGTAAEQGKYGAKTLQKANGGIEFVVAKYELVNGVFKTSDIYFQGKIPTNATTDADGFSYVITKCKNSLSYSEMVEMSKTLGIFLRFPKNGTYYLGELQFFKYIEKDGKPLLPDQIAPSKIENIYYYYKPSKDYKSIEDIKFLYKGTSPNEAYEDKYNDNAYEKIRSIKAAESNRFNLIQELCEIFECWPRFEIEHDDLGRILLGKDKIWYDEKGNKTNCPAEEEYRQQKWVSFREYIGKDNDRGFKYGINLKAIKRTIDSEAIVSKLIVKNNSNEFAKDGFCSIARADESPTGENFILNFDYYIQQGMLSLAQITNDLYSEINGSLGYYKKLRIINAKRDKYIIEQSGLLDDLAEYEASYKTYETSVNSANEQLANKLSLVGALVGETFDWLMANKESSWWKNKEVISLSSSIGHLQFIVDSHGKMRDSAKEKLQNAEARFEELNRILTSLEPPTQEQIDKGETERLLIDKENLNSAFYKKYSRFLQEGSWISEDYIDDNLYYLDAESTLFTSAHPKITYTIDVLELSQLPGYENYTFSLGDKSFIEDTEFFGWVFKNGLQTPYKEEIVVTELILMLDEPDKNQIKVQNYKTQFEELFQRMAATTQAVEYHTGEYSKASGIIKEDGTIDIVTLQNSIANNALTIQNAKDQSVIWDDTGITTTSLTSPSEIVRIVSGGIFLSRDGGATWNTGITGSGINASYLTSGQINTDEVLIMSGGYPSFRWDQSGISAYKFKLDENTGKPQSFNYSQYVRLDQYGLYGINGIDSFMPSSEDEIWEKSNFALTWKGFQIKSNNTKDGYISITSNNDFQLFANGKERIKIGKLNDYYEAERYGISIKDSEENVVMETNTDGTLWIKNKLYIGSENTSTVGIGYLDETRENSEIHEVIHAGTNEDQQFIVYEDGKMIASGAEFTGKIYATGGQIGNMTIGDVEATIQQSKKLDILSNLGYNFKVGNGTSSPEQLELIASPIGFEIDLNSIQWSGTTNFEGWEALSEGQTNYVLTYETFSQKTENAVYYIKVKCNSKDGTAYEKWVTIMAVSNGEDALNLIIVSTKGNYFKNNQGSTTLIAKLFKGGKEIDAYEPYEYTYVWKDANDSSWSREGKTLTVTANDVNFSRTYVCDVSKGGK